MDENLCDQFYHKNTLFGFGSTKKKKKKKKKRKTCSYKGFNKLK